MNNFHGTVETLLAGRVKGYYNYTRTFVVVVVVTFALFFVPGKRNWKSSLDFSVVEDMPEYKVLMKEAETYVCT